MPAVTADTAQLPRLDVSRIANATPRALQAVHTAPEGLEGEGFPVRRAFAGVQLADLDPFIHLDQMGEIEYAPFEPKGTDWHPHRGFETVTYLLDGAFAHQDSHGGGGLITNGATQWMTAGSGILHIETPPEDLVISGGLFHGIQLWVNLPASLKMTTPRYQNLDADAVGLVASPDGGALIRVIAGELTDGDVTAAGPGSTHTPIAMVHATLAPGARLALPWRPDFNALAYALRGEGTAGAGAHPFGTGQLAVFTAARALPATGYLVFAAQPTQSLDILVLGGRPIREPVAAHGPFVMNTRAELITAIEDFQAGRLGRVPVDGLHPYRRP